MKKSVCRTCVRPFVRYDLNETIDVRLGPDHYSPCQVKCIIHHQRRNEWLYDVQLDETNEILVRVSTKDLRRNYRNDLTRIPIHSRVIIMLQSSSKSPYHETGQIMQYHVSNNSYTVQFEDGEVIHHVSRRHLKLNV